MITFNIMALNKDFNIVSLLRCTNIQWSRKYHESGTFSIQIPLEQYDPTFEYIYTKDRPEVGRISQINYTDTHGYKYVQLSGQFLEHELDRMVVYSKGSGNIVDGPTWVEQSGNAEDVAFVFFNAFSGIKFNNGSADVEYDINISEGTNYHRGSMVQHVRDNSYLGNKIYHILKSSGMSYKVSYDFEDNSKIFKVWTGLDRSDDQTENNPIVFSTKYGNVRNPNILIDTSTYKSGCVVVNETTDNENTLVHVRAVIDPDVVPENNAFLTLRSSVNVNDFATLADLYQTMDNEGRSEKNTKWIRTLNLEFDTTTGSYEYMQDFDLGDICSIEIKEIGLSVNARLIGCYEVIKQGQWSLTTEFGTPIIKK